jgi:lipoyl(octanoyl) transferase
MAEIPGVRRETRWSWLGRVPYGEAVKLQLAVREALRRGEGPERLLLLEHPPTYTLGRNASAADLVAGAAALENLGVEIHECDRGGQATYHGPGQLVGYPIVDLSPDRRDVRRYVRDLQEAVVRTLAELGVAAEARASPYIGVWVREAKIASLGIHLSRWLTTHGFALNVTTELAHFDGIVPCGMPGVRLCSVASLTGQSWPVEEVARRLVAHFAAVFDRRLEEAPAADLPGVGSALLEREPSEPLGAAPAAARSRAG